MSSIFIEVRPLNNNLGSYTTPGLRGIKTNNNKDTTLIRDNLFIVNGVINFARKEKLEVDINLYDIAKCFD